MSKVLVLAEKPSVGRDLARVLKCIKKGNGFFEGNKYIVTWALGHLVTLADPEAYDEKYKSWNISDLPILPKYFKLIIIKQSHKQFNVVKDLLNRKDVNEIVIATDAGREGELVARWIIEKSRVNKETKRLWISSVTDKAILDGFSKLKSGKEYENLYASAVARAEADWIVGINATRALTCKHNAQLSCGRVQTPTIQIIKDREDEIKNFKPKKYYGIKAISNDIELVWHDKNNNINVFDENKIDGLIKKLRNKKLDVIDIDKKEKKAYSKQLYDLTELQRDCNRLYGFSPKETLSLMQRLYENYKILTYPRTDSRYLTNDIVDTIKDRVKACGVGAYSKFTNVILRDKISANKNFVDDKKVSDHHAIIPTEEPVKLNLLGDKERKVYELVIKRFLSVLLPPFKYEETVLVCEVEREKFVAKANSVISYGWKELYLKDDLDEEAFVSDKNISQLKRGESLTIKSFVKTSGETKAPSYFNEATLLSAMENPSKYMKGESKELIKTIGETGGLGTVATRADIIEKLFGTFLLEKKGKDIHLTSKGRQLLELAPEELKAPTLTAEWEQKLGAIAKGNLNKNKFIQEMIEYTNKIVAGIKNSNEKFTHDNMTRSKCPECGKYMLEVNGKKGRMLVCQDRECGYREGLSRVTNARCPECHKKLELRGKGEGQIYVCSNTNCSFKEKASSFNKRFKNKNDKLNKKDVQNYMRKMKKEADEPVNSALADALAKLNLK